MRIERDKDGFATDECLDEIFNSLPVVVRGAGDSIYFVDDSIACCMRGEIERDSYYTHWQPIVIPEFTE